VRRSVNRRGWLWRASACSLRPRAIRRGQRGFGGRRAFEEQSEALQRSPRPVRTPRAWEVIDMKTATDEFMAGHAEVREERRPASASTTTPGYLRNVLLVPLS
jgi:hypothetical protein